MRYLSKLLILCFLTAIAAHAGSKVSPPVAPPQPPQSNEQNAHPTPAPQPETSPSNGAPMQSTEVTPLPSSQEMTQSYEGAFVRMLVTLLGLILLVVATFWVLRRLGKGKFKLGGGQSLQVIERKALSPKTMLYIVEINNKKVLISESQVEVRSHATFEEPPVEE